MKQPKSTVEVDFMCPWGHMDHKQWHSQSIVQMQKETSNYLDTPSLLSSEYF